MDNNGKVKVFVMDVMGIYKVYKSKKTIILIIYQLLTKLASSKKDYMDLVKEDIKSYRKILKPFAKVSDKEEGKINIDSI